jgi:hypothetical protein
MVFPHADLKGRHRKLAVAYQPSGPNHGLYAVLMSSNSERLEILFLVVAGEALVADLHTRISDDSLKP